MLITLLISTICMGLAGASMYMLYRVVMEGHPVIWPALKQGYFIHGIVNPEFQNSLFAVLKKCNLAFEETQLFIPGKTAIADISDFLFPQRGTVIRTAVSAPLGMVALRLMSGEEAVLDEVIAALRKHYAKKRLRTVFPAGSIGGMTLLLLLTLLSPVKPSLQSHIEESPESIAEQTCIDAMKDHALAIHVEAVNYIARNQEYLATCKQQVMQQNAGQGGR